MASLRRREKRRSDTGNGKRRPGEHPGGKIIAGGYGVEHGPAPADRPSARRTRRHPARERLARAAAADLDELLGAMELVERAGVARDRHEQVGRLRGELEARDRLLHDVE